METKKIKKLKIEQVEREIKDLFRPKSFAIRSTETGDVFAIFRYKINAENWLQDYTAGGWLEIVCIEYDYS